jgi:hypothetical protein
MQPLLSKAFANKHVPMEMIGATSEELRFLLVRTKGLLCGQLGQGSETSGIFVGQ